MTSGETRLLLEHRPVLDVFARLDRPGDARAYELGEDQVAGFERDGFVAGLRVLDDDQVAELRRRVDAIRRDLASFEGRLYEVEQAHLERPDEVVAHFLGGWMIDPWLHDLIFSPAVAVPMAQLLGTPSLRLWHDQVFYKPPHHRGCVPWHQDYSYWTRATPARHVSMHIVLDDADVDNGCLHMVPGSHRWELLPAVSFDAPIDSLLEHLPPDRREAFAPVPVRLRAGEASIHHSHTVHGSHPNCADRPRRALVINAMHPDTRCADGSRPLLRGVPLLPEGAVIEGDHFPLVHCGPSRTTLA